MKNTYALAAFCCLKYLDTPPECPTLKAPSKTFRNDTVEFLKLHDKILWYTIVQYRYDDALYVNNILS